ncbi:MAG: hypothetical protein KVP17_003917 [Porospora cf. gigantea B]|uniref:uncharacterized protein n=1 Tax=Porospora cf. gigantea B TaxID=2853592 RepID=UPI0035718A1C|nr:MAG: hypothetical protein KVP17_003917 [Porospora cf. gigantea B]
MVTPYRSPVCDESRGEGEVLQFATMVLALYSMLTVNKLAAWGVLFGMVANLALSREGQGKTPFHVLSLGLMAVSSAYMIPRFTQSTESAV